MDAYICIQGPTIGIWSPFTIFMPRKVRKEEKPHGQNPPSRKDKAQNLNKMSSTYLYLHLNELNELLLNEILDEEIMNSMVMR